MRKQGTRPLAALLLLATGFCTLAEEPAVVVLVDADEVDGAVVIDVQAAESADGGEPAAQQQQQQQQQQAEQAEQEAQEKKPTDEELRQKMMELQEQLRDARDAFQQQANERRQQVRRETTKAINDIELPKAPTREQCQAFIAELRQATTGRNSFSSNDPATEKLKGIPMKHWDLLAAEITNNTSLRNYANYAMRDVEPELLRERFVTTIDENPDTIGIIVMYGWVEDIRPTVIKKIENADGTLAQAWFQAAVELSEPSLYPKLHEITTQSRFASQFIQMLSILPDYDLGHTLDACWEKAETGDLPINRSAFALKAAEYGNRQALGLLIEQLGKTNGYISHPSTYNTRRTNVLRFIDYRGSNKDIQAWYKANQDKLVFDHLRKRFIVPDGF